MFSAPRPLTKKTMILSEYHDEIIRLLDSSANW